MPRDLCDLTDREIGNALDNAAPMPPVAPLPDSEEDHGGNGATSAPVPSSWSPSTLADTWPRVLAELELRAAGGYNPVSTGLPSLDSLLCGGLPRGATAVLTAPPGYGKTSFALALCLDQARAGVPTIFWSLELTEEDAHARLVCLERGLPWAEVRTGKHMEATREVAQALTPLPMCLLDADRLTLELLPSAISKLVDAHEQAPLIVVDYAQLLADPATDKDARVAAERVAKELLDLAKRTGATMLLLSSVARSAYGRRSDSPEDYRGMAKESGRWESDAAVELAIAPTGEVGPRDKRGWLMCSKNRLGGPTGKVAVSYDGLSGRWTEVAGDAVPERQGAISDPDLKTQILEAVGNHEIKSVKSVKTMVHGQGQRIGNMVKDMLRTGELLTDPEGVFRKP